MTDRFHTHSAGLESPAFDAFSIVPDDNADIAEITRALYIGGAGDIVVITKMGTEITFSNLSDGWILPVRVSRVKASGTSATNIVGLI